jgi:thiamine biosynthesis lipoprotein
MIAIGAASATVVGPLGWLCDGLATALMVAGENGAKFFAQPELAGYEVFVIGRHENAGWGL